MDADGSVVVVPAEVLASARRLRAVSASRRGLEALALIALLQSYMHVKTNSAKVVRVPTTVLVISMAYAR